MRILIKNGTIVTAVDQYKGDVLIEDEKITVIGTALEMAADKVIDATGKYVLPGGIDVHTHMDMPFGGTTSADDFATGTIAVVPPKAAATVPLSKSSAEVVPPNGMSMWVCTSMPPGSTYLPEASIVLSACISSELPMTVIFSSSTSTSPVYWSEAVTTVPF